jgi:hypothetical protein
MDDRFYRDRARVLRELATQADPLIKRRLLRLASNYEYLTTARDQDSKMSGQSSDIDGTRDRD